MCCFSINVTENSFEWNTDTTKMGGGRRGDEIPYRGTGNGGKEGAGGGGRKVVGDPGTGGNGKEGTGGNGKKEAVIFRQQKSN